MGKEYVMNAVRDIEELAKQEGLDFFPTIFEIVDHNIMLEGCSYGLPVRSRHWSYGRSYDQQKLYGEMGFSKVYEIVFNNNPSYAFLLNTNPDVINIMVAAHVFGHVHFFKNNIMFKDSDRGMIYRAAERATRVDKYIEQYGLDKVEHLMDIGFALDNHIDWNRGVFRKKYPKKKIVSSTRKRAEFDDLLNIGNTNKSPTVIKRVIGDKLPPYPEKDLLWFLTNYAQLEDWESDILSIAREESFYFYPIVMTKCLNEGFACVLPESLVFSNNGIISMEEMVDQKCEVFDGNDVKNVCHSGIFKNRDVIKVFTKRGLCLGGANNHRILNVQNEWVQLDEIKLGDKIKISGGNNLWGSNYIDISYSVARKATPLAKLCRDNCISYSTYYRHKNNTHKTTAQNIKKIQKVDTIVESEKLLGTTSCLGNRQSLNIPGVVDENIASFIGYIIGDGHVSDSLVGFTTGDDCSKNDFIGLHTELFGRPLGSRWDNSSKNGRWRISIHSKHMVDFLVRYFDFEKGKTAHTKKIPHVILKSPKSVVSAFLRSYFDCDGCASTQQGIILSTSSDKLSEQVQVVLLNYGILSRRNKVKDECWQLRITGKSAGIFYDEIGFGLERKNKKLKQYLDNHKQWHKEEWEDEIVKIEHCGKQDVYDISVEETHRYAANGFINHNSFWHAELMHKYDKLSEEEYINFAKVHSGVINPGNPFNINPYFLGFKILTDIRKRWDDLYKEGKSDIDGIQKVFQVAAEEDDASFLRNYLTKDLVRELGLFNYGYKNKRKPDVKKEDLSEEDGIIELKDRDLNKIVENLVRHTINYGAPLITINESDGDTLVLEHRDDFGPLDEKYTEKTMSYLFEIWGGPIELKTKIEGLDGKQERVVFVFDEGGFDIQ